jgi:hypothetical protein
MPIVRILSLSGLAGGFLLISPTLREDLTYYLGAFVGDLDKYSPYSYVALGFVVIGIFMLSLVRSSAPR